MMWILGLLAIAVFALFAGFALNDWIAAQFDESDPAEWGDDD